MRFLLFGAAGLFGSEFENACLRRGLPVVALRRPDCDITDPHAIRRVVHEHRPDALVNAAGMIDIDRCEADPEAAFRAHCVSAMAMAEAAVESGAIHVQTGTHLVFDGTSGRAYVEDDRTAPGTVYAATKLAAESLAAWRCPRSYAVRFPTLYGERRNTAVGFVDRMLATLRRGDTVRVADDRMDSTTYAADAADAVIDLVTQGSPWGIHHVANGGPHSYFDFVDELNRQLGSPGVVLRAKDADFRKSIAKPLRVSIVSTKLPPLRPWREALRGYLTRLHATNPMLAGS